MIRKVKKYEGIFEKTKIIEEGTLLILGRMIYPEKSEVLYECSEFTDEILKRDFDIKSGEWWTEDGWVVGKNRKKWPGMIVSKADYFGDVMLKLTAKMVSPSTHDINVMINGAWDEEKDERGMGYVAGLEAFWHGNIGFEKSPEYKIHVATPVPDFDPEKEYEFLVGNIGGKVFIAVDGKVCMEIKDPDPIDTSKYGKIGFEAFASWWKFKDVKVLKPYYDQFQENYLPEF